MKKIIILLFPLLLLSISCEDNHKQDETFNDRFENLLDQAITEYGGKGVSASIMFPDGHIESATAGISHNNIKILPSTLFGIGSISKTFTAVLVLKQVEAGSLSLEDTIGKWYPDFENIDGSITIRQLLNHTSGIFDISENIRSFTYVLTDPDKFWERTEILNDLVLAPYFQPGQGWHYSTSGYVILRQLLEDITSKDISVILNDYINEPIGLNHTYFYPYEEPYETVANSWFDLNFDGQDDNLGSSPWKSLFSLPGGNILSTSEEVVKFSNALLHDRILIPDSLYTEMVTTVSTGQSGREYGLGIQLYDVDQYNGLNVYGHGGNIPGFKAVMIYIVEKGISICILINSQSAETLNVLSDLINLAIEDSEAN